MKENAKPEYSNPLSTIEDIKKRLRRPAELHSPSEWLNSSPLNPTLKKSGTVKKKLEDYLDPILLAALSSKIGRSKKAKLETKFKRDGYGFEWPVDELNVFAENDSSNSNRGSWRNEAFDLNNDFDAIGDGDENIGSLFQRFEKKVLKKFQH
ncbi:hypothetical protein F3Y22_tig00110610pilonHSYRG00902 [Hibiscus syriacus]|uniref:Uncharacterized protein n=1 Tax=Hibiscus syriacus TaxID=106335 RepID=A0A6A3A142_HIBSY|nr:uncharacterized protein LOC120135707 [Hibiscus syriacus]KAE8697878.1 hypothetical protein F3Y22_tig00110610pilonHSYRG00902 [Hibiscus syriacus]